MENHQTATACASWGPILCEKKTWPKKMKVAEFPLHSTGLDAVLESFFYFSSMTSFQGLSLSYF